MSRSFAQTSILDDYSDASHAYTTSLFPAGKGWNLLLRLMRMGGAALGRTWGSLSPSEIGEKALEIQSVLDAGIDGEGIASMIDKLALQMIEEGGDKFIREILATTNRDELPINESFDAVYQGNYGEMLKAVGWVLKHNYAPFFKGALGNLGSSLMGALAKTQLRSVQSLETAQSTSTSGSQP